MAPRESFWFRKLGNRRNQSYIDLPGPQHGRIVRSIPLENQIPVAKNQSRRANGVVAADGSLRIVAYGLIHKLTTDGEYVWSRNLVPHILAEPDDPEDARTDVDVFKLPQATLEHTDLSHAPPTMLEGDTALVVLPNRTLILDAEGAVISVIRRSVVTTGAYSPNLTFDQHPIFADFMGVSILESEGIHHLKSARGYDFDPPAVYEDETFAIAAYYDTGFCRVRRDDSIVWRTDLRQADLVPTLNNADYAAVGSANDRISMIYTPDGKAIARYGAAARFARHRDDGWIAFTKTRLARLAADGKLIWEQTFPADEGWIQGQHPIVDGEGHVYMLSQRQHLHSYDEKGRTRFVVKFDEPLKSMFPIRAGRFGVIAGYQLHLIE